MMPPAGARALSTSQRIFRKPLLDNESVKAEAQQMIFLLIIAAWSFGLKLGLSIFIGILGFLIWIVLSLFGASANPETGRSNPRAWKWLILASLIIWTIWALNGCSDKSPDQWYNHLNPLYHDTSSDVYVNSFDQSEWMIVQTATSKDRVSLVRIPDGRQIDVDPTVFKTTFFKRE